MQMWQHMEFGNALATWAIDLPDDAKDAAATWNVLSNLKVDNPVVALRSAVQGGDVGPSGIAKAVERAAATLAAAERSQSIVAELDLPCAQRFFAAVATETDVIIAALKPHFAEAVERLTEATQIIPAGLTATDVLARGPEAAGAWHDLANAAGALDTIAALRRTLVNQYGGGAESPAVAAYLSGTFTDKELVRAQYLHTGVGIASTVAVDLEQDRGDGAGRWATLVRAGYVLTLNTRAEVSALLARTAQAVA